MEKLIYALWCPEGHSRDDFNQKLIGVLPEKLLDAGAKNIRLNIQDDHVVAGNGLRQQWQQPQPDGLLQFWLASAYKIYREPVDAIIADFCARFEAWTVAESTILSPPEDLRSVNGRRSPGWAQIALIAKPKEMDHTTWIKDWQDRHTKVAIETQSNFAYTQNAVVRSLTDGAPDYAAIVEECFPDEALSNPMVFFDAANDQKKFKANLDRMMDSCASFIADGMIDVMATSQYDFKGLASINFTGEKNG